MFLIIVIIIIIMIIIIIIIVIYIAPLVLTHISSSGYLCVLATLLHFLSVSLTFGEQGGIVSPSPAVVCQR